MMGKDDRHHDENDVDWFSVAVQVDVCDNASGPTLPLAIAIQFHTIGHHTTAKSHAATYLLHVCYVVVSMEVHAIVTVTIVGFGGRERSHGDSLVVTAI